jgi:uncharacterized membrane protein YbjE (DUF340 family)
MTTNRMLQMTSKYVLRVVLTLALCVALSTSAEAQTEQKGNLDFTGYKVAIAVAVAAVVVVAVVLIHRSSKKQAIAGCVNSGENGMSMTDEKDKRIYVLSGNVAGIKPGDRIALQGKKVKPKGNDKIVVWEVSRVTKDSGVCQP